MNNCSELWINIIIFRKNVTQNQDQDQDQDQDQGQGS